MTTAIQRATTWLLTPTRPVLAPLLRVTLLLWLLLERFDEPGPKLLRDLGSRPLPLLHAPHVEALMSALGAWPVTTSTATTLGLVLQVATVCAILGVFTRVSLVVVAAAFICFYGVMSGWGFFNHTPAIGGQLVVALAVVPGTTSWSVDRLLLAWWRRRRGRDISWADGLAPTVPRFGETVLLLVVGSLYFASGVAKLRYDPGDWFNGHTLQFYLSGAASRANFWIGPAGTDLVSAYVYGAQPPSWVRSLATSTALCAVVSWMTVVIEVGAPFFLLRGGRWRVLWCVAAIGFHMAIIATMGISFAMWSAVDALVAFVVVVPWVVTRLQARRQARGLTAPSASAADDGG